ncbi:MAG: DUF480 domain-containing protein [Planctomycetota bacterium]
MAEPLDRTEQRIVGVLIEKELAVPETYPMTLNSLVLGCNQKSNRDPISDLEEFQVEGALTSLCLKDWCGRREGSRAIKYVHRTDERLGVGRTEKAILAELLLRGPQTPTELRTRVARMGVHLEGAAIADALDAMSQRADGGLVELLPRRPRERDARWRHLLGPMLAEHEGASDGADESRHAPTTRERNADVDVHARLEALERRLDEVERRLGEITG